MTLATMSDAVREYARNVGAERPDRAWILSPYDTWERNPCYSGPPARHPEDDYDEDEVAGFDLGATELPAAAASPADPDDFDVPF
jgi:hypothetical protein